MTLVNQLILLTTALWNLFFRVLYLPAAIFAWLITLLQQWRAILALILVGAAFFVVAQYGGTVANEVEFAFRCRINPYYNETVRPILSGIIRQYFNNIVCWYNGIVWFPYGWGREVIFPILRDGGFGATVLAFGRFLNQIGQDVFIGYVATGNMFSQELDLSRVCTAWQTFWASWQGLWCFGCNDLCPYFTKLPMIPAFWTSDQYGDDAWWCFMSNMINGWIVLIQRVIYIIREIIWPTQPVRPRFEFKRSFDLFCAASTCFWKSWENAMQKVWDNFVPYKLAWVDLLCFFDKVTCAWIRFAYLLLNMTVNYDQVFNHFAARSSDFWVNQVKEDFKEIINTIGRASYFDPIIVPLPPGMGNMSITHYRLDPLIQAKPNGDPNPLFNQTNAGDCLCLAITRLLCDPQNNGTTCAQQFNGTLLATVDPCCLGTELGTTIADISSSIFEITLHLKGTNDFVLFLDRQPFTGLIKQGLVRINTCIAQIFLAVQTYGGCLSVIVAELGDFIICSSELVIRIVVALITLPYFDAFLPGYCNFITCPGDNALSQTLRFLDKLSNETNPNGLINCMCFTLNSAFNVPFAGCGNVTCKPTGFIDPTTGIQQRGVTGPGYTSYTYSDSFYNLTSYSGLYSHRLTPIMTYGGVTPNSFQFSTKLESYSAAKYAMKDAFNILDERLAKFGEDWKCGVRESSPGDSGQCPLRSQSSARLVSLNITNVAVNCTDPLNPTPNPPPCFNLCCLPKKVTQLFFHTIAFSARAINAGFQARFSVNGSDYWSGDACMDGRDCFQSDATMFITKAIAPIECLCEFIKLVLPPQGFGDPCCGFTIAAELISCAIQVIINIGNSIGGDSPNFTYLRDPKFLAKDFDVLLEISLKLFDCLCNVVRTIFSVAAKGRTLQNAFDPCCVFRVWFRVILEALRLLFRAIMSLATLDMKESECYLYINSFGNARPGCPISVADLGIVKQFQQITMVLLAPPVTQVQLEQCAVTMDVPDVNNDGLPTCLCRVVNALLAMVYQITNGFVGSYEETPQCTVNLCCIIYSYGRVLKEVLDLASQLAASLWQNWEYRTISLLGTTETFFIPQETLYFFFCDEYGAVINLPDGTPNPMYYGNTAPIFANFGPYNGTSGIINPDTDSVGVAAAKCGRLEPAIQALFQLLGGCLCQKTNLGTSTGSANQSGNGLANILDELLRWLLAFASGNSTIFPFQVVWPRCFCNGGPVGAYPRGIIGPAARAITVAVRQIAVTIRNVANPTFWAFQGGTFNDASNNVNILTDNFQDLRKTWINRFVGPFADAMCSLITNAGCLLSMILGETCSETRYNVLSSFTRYYFETIIRIASAIEGAVKLFTQEPPGLCVGAGSDGNKLDPTTQGSQGETNQLVPTCSPVDNYETLGLDGGQIGRILNSILNYFVDALIGVGRFGCTTVCPGFDPNQVSPYSWSGFFTQGRPQLQANDGTIISQQTVCDCWNKSPFTGLATAGGSICGFELCDKYYNSGLGTFKCGNGTDQTCLASIAKLPPNTGLPIDATAQKDLDAGFCQACTNETSIVASDSQVYIPQSTVSWIELFPQYPFIPIVLNYQPSGLACKIVNNAILTDPVALGEVEKLGRGLLTPVPVGPLPPTITGPITLDNVCNTVPTTSPRADFQINYMFSTRPYYAGACYIRNTLCSGPNPGGDDYFAYIFFCSATTPVNPVLIGVYNQYFLLWGSYPSTPISSPETRVIDEACQLCQMAVLNQTTFSGERYNATIQHTCDRKYCILERGLCKNDQMVPCRQGGPILDGVVIVSLKYLNCLMQELFGDFPSAVIRPLLTVLSIIWQLSAGIIRLIVAIFMVLWSFFFEPFILAITTLFPRFVGILGLFINIFTQPVAFSYKRNVQVDPMQSLELFYDFDDAHDCISAPDLAACFCRAMNMRPFCSYNETSGTVSPPGLSTTQVLMYVRDHFKGETNCDMLLHDLVQAAPTSWVGGVDEAQRYQVVECVTKRSQGDRWNFLSNGVIDEDFFYNPRGFYKLMKKSLHHAVRFVKEYETVKTEARKVRGDPFEHKFKMTRDHFYKLVNSRGEMLRRYYIEEHDFAPDSPTLEFMLKIDMRDFFYRFGYYHYLIEEATWTNFRSKMGTMSESWDELTQSVTELTERTRVIWDAHAPEVKKYVKHVIPPTPPVIRAALDGTLWKGLSEMFPVFSLPGKIRFNPPTLEQVSLLLPQNQVWTKHVSRNLDTGMRLIYKGLHHIWPQYTTKENHDRFILGGNCRIVDGTVKLGTEVVDYCLNEFRENIPALKQSPVGRYLENTSHLRHGSFFNKYRGKLTWNTSGSGEWKRPKIDYIPLEARTTVHRHMYQRAVPSETLIGKLLVWFFNLFGVDAKQTIDNFLLDFRDWVSNPSTSIQDYPNVGARYWATFFFRCEWPENINCSIGIGLGEALWKVGVVFLIVILILAFTFPQALSIISGIIIFLIYVITVAIVAWHYSPACLSLFPAIVRQNGVTIPVAPVPLNGIFPLIPECLWDDVIHVLDSVFAACYTWIPAGWLNGPQCPTCDARIGLPNCVDVGVSTPLEALVYWGYQIMGMLWCDIMRGLSTTIIFSWIPGFTSGVDTTCTLLATASPSQLDRMRLCGYLASGTLAWFAIGFWALGLFIIAVIGPLLNIGHGFLLLLPTLPHYDALVGVGEAQGSFVMDGEDAQGEEEEGEETPVKFVPQRRGISDYMASLIRRTVLPHSKTE